MPALPLLAGLALLTLGAEMLVRGSIALATRLRIPPLVIGLTVVAFGTSAPELAVSVRAVLADEPSVAVANVVGSNTFNVLFILGICALLSPLSVASRLVRLDVPLLIAASVLVFLLARDGSFSLPEGLALLAGLSVYTGWGIRAGRTEEAAISEEFAEAIAPGARPWLAHPAVSCAVVAVGLGALVLGARWFTDGAVGIARRAGVDETVVGLTIVAAGTSMPEVATSILATLRGQRDVAIGNVIGSNLFNLLGIVGLASVVAKDGLAVHPTLLRADFPVMLLATAACLPILFTGARIVRWEGALLLAGYLLYTSWLVAEALSAPGAVPIRAVGLYGFVPLAVAALLLATLRQIRAGSATYFAATR